MLPQLAHHFEVKIYFLRRAPFLAALSYGKEKLVAQARGDGREMGGRWAGDGREMGGRMGGRMGARW